MQRVNYLQRKNYFIIHVGNGDRIIYEINRADGRNDSLLIIVLCTCVLFRVCRRRRKLHSGLWLGVVSVEYISFVRATLVKVIKIRKTSHFAIDCFTALRLTGKKISRIVVKILYRQVTRFVFVFVCVCVCALYKYNLTSRKPNRLKQTYDVLYYIARLFQRDIVKSFSQLYKYNNIITVLRIGTLDFDVCTICQCDCTIFFANLNTQN